MITSDAGLLAYRELGGALSLTFDGQKDQGQVSTTHGREERGEAALLRQFLVETMLLDLKSRVATPIGGYQSSKTPKHTLAAAATPLGRQIAACVQWL